MRCKRILKPWHIIILVNLGLSMHTSAQIQTNVPALKDVFAKDFYIGCLLSYPHIGFASDPVVAGQSSVVDVNGGYLIKYHMNSMSPGNNMKPIYTVDMTGSAAAYAATTTQTQKDSINVRPLITFNGNLIAQLNWARRQGFTFRGHTLVWHNQTPGTGFFRTGYSTTGDRLTKATMTDRLENYIKEMIRLLHEGWPGLLSAYDVVNEALNDDGTDRTDSEWYITFGDNSYIAKAFEFARKYTKQYGETQIKLYYNDYNTYVAAKADGIVRLCGPIFRAGNLDGLGMQEHDAFSYPTAEQWIATYNKYDTICTEMAVTELDINTNSGTNTPSASILAQQANQYGQLFKCFVQRSYKSGRGKIINVSKDGLNDQYTFVTNQATSLWDTKDQCKPAFYAVVDVGRNYNTLDSLITYAITLQQNKYTASSWTALAGALSAAQAAKAQNYSVSVSAATALGAAKDSLNTAMNSLVRIVSGVASTEGLSGKFALSQNYPNPFNPSTNFEVRIASQQLVCVSVFDVLGREVAVLVDGVRPAGVYTVHWDASSLSSGVYYYRLQAGAFVESKKMVLMK
jgi:endo-1,4-beta-xylanase